MDRRSAAGGRERHQDARRRRAHAAARSRRHPRRRAADEGAPPRARAGALVFVKICGVRTLEDALWAAECGADAIGFNFWPQSKRYLPVEEAGRIAKKLPARLSTVGVFVNAAESEVMAAFRHGAVDFVQFHGDEPPEFCRRFAGIYWKAVRLADEKSLQTLDGYGCDLVL